jgi:hypothetical protein
MLQLMIAGVLALAATTGSAAYAANASNPGDALHGLDIAMENVQLNLAPDVASKVQLQLEFASERLAEAQRCFQKMMSPMGWRRLMNTARKFRRLLNSSEVPAEQIRKH